MFICNLDPPSQLGLATTTKRGNSTVDVRRRSYLAYGEVLRCASPCYTKLNMPLLPGTVNVYSRLCTEALLEGTIIYLFSFA